MSASSGIYRITCSKNGKSYIGKTEGKIYDRIEKHLDGKSPGCRALHAAIKKYGKEHFTWDILHENVIPELLSDFEKQSIKAHNTVSPNGYNLTWGGETGKHSMETIQKRTETLRANPPMLGKKHSPEACRKMSESRTGLKRSKETRQRMSEASMGHEVSQATRDKIGSANALPQKSDVHKTFLSLPPEMPLREKTETLSAKFPNVKQKTINYWLSEWDPHKTSAVLNENMQKRYFSLSASLTLGEKRKIIHEEYSGFWHRETINRKIRKWETDVPHAKAPKIDVQDLFDSLPFAMELSKKRKILYSEFPSVKRQTINEWTRKWSNSTAPKTRPEYHDAYKHYLSLPDDMSLPKKRQLLRNKFPCAPKYAISKWVRKWSNTPASRKAMRHVDYDKAHKFFLSFSSDMNLRDKQRLLSDNFPDISPSSWHKWIKKWTGKSTPVGAPSHSLRPEIYEYFLSLPQDMPISEKRKSILEKFGNTVSRSLVNSWTRKWHTEITGSPPPDERWYREPPNNHKKGKPAYNRRPEYDKAKDFFLHLPSGMPSSEKGRKLRKKYPHIPTGTISQWLHRWQSELDKKMPIVPN